MLKLTNKKLGGNMKEKFKSIWDNTTAKIIIFVATSIIIPATVQFIGENLLNFKFLEGHPTLAFVFYCAVFILLTLFIVSVIKLIKFLFVKKDLFEDTNNKIESVCSKYQYKSNFIADKEIKSELKIWQHQKFISPICVLCPVAVLPRRWLFSQKKRA